MNVWIVPASDSASARNVDKTLSTPITPARLLAAGLPVEQNMYAWGTQANASSGQIRSYMKPGDVCFFYTQEGRPRTKGVHWAAVVKGVAQAADAQVSEALWDTTDFPWFYLLHPPVKLSMSIAAFNQVLAAVGVGNVSVRMLHRLIKDEDDNAFIDSQGGCVEWIESLGVQFPPAAGAPVRVQVPVGFNLPDHLSEELIRTPLAQGAGGGVQLGAGAQGRRSKQSKEVGDRGEAIVEQYIREKVAGARNVKSVAADRTRPGRDIDYVDGNGQQIMVEVKATTISSFTGFDLTAAEMEMAAEQGENYHLYLVANCLGENPEIQQVVDPYSRVAAGEWTSTTTAFRINFG